MLRPRPVSLVVALAAAAACTAWVAPARAGCGCDHPPPPYATVMPPFASPGKVVTIHAEGGEFVPGESYEVDFRSGSALETVAESASYLQVAVPRGLDPGPVALRIRGGGSEVEYPESVFTALPVAPVLRDETELLIVRDFPAAVSADGTFLLPMDLTNVANAMQFALEIADLPLTFTPDDVVFYNADGVDLTLFTLEVEDPTERQWGSYYGWEVEQDEDIYGEVYESKVIDEFEGDGSSDLLTYWRHDFYEYKAAHEPGESHEVDANGRHRDGTLHIDHYHVVLAITGRLRDPTDPTGGAPLVPGRVDVTLAAAGIQAPKPIEVNYVTRGLTKLSASPTLLDYDDLEEAADLDD